MTCGQGRMVHDPFGTEFWPVKSLEEFFPFECPDPFCNERRDSQIEIDYHVREQHPERREDATRL